MNILFALRIGFALILTAILAGSLSIQEERERNGEIQPKKARYTPFLPVGLLPLLLAMYVPLFWWQYGWEIMMETMAAICFTVLIQLSFYTAFLMAVLPLLRRWLRPSTCAILWMLPNYLYLTINPGGGLLPERPWLVVRLPGLWFVLLGTLWLAGFGAVMAWGVVSHLRFRRKILAPARPVTEPEILELLEQERAHAGQRKRRYRLVRSPAVGTPLTIGLFSRSTRIVLPKRTYTPEELRLILRHEMVHIGRRDSEAKFYLLFCTALGWWNPLMWLARRRSADDLELSCDETVLRSLDGNCRRPYAELLLRTAGDQRGFTTCLSASAGALRYRLRQVMEPGKRARGITAVAVACVLLVLTAGSVTVGYLPDKGQETLLDGIGAETFAVEQSFFWEYGRNGKEDCIRDESALWQYLAEAEFYRVSPLLYNLDLRTEGQSATIFFQRMDASWVMDLYGDYVVCSPWGQRTQRQCYYCPGILDGLLQLGILEVDEELT